MYDKVQEGEDTALSKEYLEEFVPIAKRRLVLSGHRLAYLIRRLFKRYMQLNYNVANNWTRDSLFS